MKKDRSTQRRDNYERLIVIRANHLFKNLHLVGKCADPKKFRYTQEDVDHLFKSINKELKNQKKKFDLGLLNMNEKPFKLR
ncbi:MAG: hypothetical protein CMP84_16335 [Gammaproteobacteria bacterium]|nr:hypothetical protein [Gammaproteobacteria bacterium]|tara:strand:- start:1960 stop:2202 length:243 start_codon:yes stop_codon:yes gene_type:complete